MELIDALAQETADMPLHVQTDRVIKDSGLRTMYEQEKGEKGQTRIENLEELVTATRRFRLKRRRRRFNAAAGVPLHAALDGSGRGAGGYLAGRGAVDDATLGERAGVPQVFIVGMEEGMFQSQMSLG